MPELPEVETTVRKLRKVLLWRKILDLWTDTQKLIKKPSFHLFKKKIKGLKILAIKRRGKNIIFKLEKGNNLLIHQKLTGHLLYGKWKREKNQWVSKIPGPLKEDPMNRFLHFILFLDNGFQLALSDLRKFAKVELLSEKELSEELKELGPDILKVSFDEFSKKISSKKKAIKEILMDQRIFSGVGNIYSDEALFLAKIHPLRKSSEIKRSELKKLYFSLRKVLLKAIELGGESISDYRKPNGTKGEFDKLRKVYRKTGEKCFVCNGIIKRIKIGARSAHFCPNCQK